MSKHSKNNPDKLMGSGHHSLSKRQPLFFSSKEISPEEIINSYDINSHKVNNSPKMSISSFGDFTFTFEFARLINSCVNTSKGYKIFMGTEEVRDGFSFSGNTLKVLYVLGDREFGDGVFVDEEKPGNSEGIFFISLSLSEGELSEVGDKKRIDDNNIDAFGRKEGVKIDVIAARGLHSGKDRREIRTDRRNSPKQFKGSIRIHVGANRETGIAFSINTSCREGIFGNINTDKKIVHTNTSNRIVLNRIVLDKAGTASRPILHSYKGSETQSTYDGCGRQGTDSFEGSKTQEKWSSPAYPVLIYMWRNNSYNLYNTNS